MAAQHAHEQSETKTDRVLELAWMANVQFVQHVDKKRKD